MVKLGVLWYLLMEIQCTSKMVKVKNPPYSKCVVDKGNKDYRANKENGVLRVQQAQKAWTE